MCECASPWNSMPMKSQVKRSRPPPSPMSASCSMVMWCTTGLGLSGPALVSSGQPQVTVRPARTSALAARTCAGVM